MRGARALWPQLPLALLLGMVGVLSILDGFRFRLEQDLAQVAAISDMASSLATLGHSAQVIVGSLTVLVSVGLAWRLVSAWTLSVVLLLIAVIVTALQAHWGPGLALQLLLLGALLVTRRRFNRRTILSRILYSISGVLAVLTYGAVGSFLLGKGFDPEIDGWGSAFYFTVVALSTVGFGDIVPISNEARWFVMSLLVIGLGVFASAIASALGPKISSEFDRLFNPKEIPMEPRDHVILVGTGAIALNAASELKQRGVPFVHIVDKRVDEDDAGQLTIEGDATHELVLKQAGVLHARMVIAASEDDGENAFVVLGSKDLNPALTVLAVASSPVSIRRLKLARADLVFSPAAVGSRLLADLVQGNQIPTQFGDLLEGLPPRT